MTTPLRPRTAAIHAWFEKNNGGCVHFDKGFGPYAQCEDPDVGVPIRALDQVCEAEAAPDLRAALAEACDRLYECGFTPTPSMLAALDAPAAEGLRQVQAREQSAVGAPHAEPYKQPAADGLDVLRPENLVAERVIASGIADVVERRGEEWFDGMRARGEYLELATRILEEISRRAPNEPSREPDDGSNEEAETLVPSREWGERP